MNTNQIESTREAYETLGKDFSTIFITDATGNVTEEINYDYQTYLNNLFEIEKFVLQVIASPEPAYLVKQNNFGRLVLVKRPLAKYLKMVNDFAYLYSPEYKFGVHVQLFFDCYIQLKLSDVHFYTPNGYTPYPGLLQHELFNKFLDSIRAAAKTATFRAKLANGIAKAKQNQVSAIKYINLLFEKYSRYMVMRIDFSYQSQYAKDITPDQAKRDFKLFLNNRRSNHSLFKHFRGYLWKLEWGYDKACHFHLVLFYDGAHVRKDSHWAQKIGDYWKYHITGGRGIFFNCNASKQKYKRLGIGMVSRHDIEKRKILTADVVSYLTKGEQFFQATSADHGRCYGKGEISGNNQRPQEVVIQNSDALMDME
ncbi:MAG: inovirus-type Gp2 protein [Gallionella sp.]|jgi:hypothetical protein